MNVVQLRTFQASAMDCARLQQRKADAKKNGKHFIPSFRYEVLPKSNPNHVPAGSPEGGQFAPAGGGGSTLNPSNLKATAKKLFDEAAKPRSAYSEEAAKIAPSLRKEFWDKATSTQRDAVINYTQGGGYREINKVLRGGKSVPGAVSQIKAISSLFHDKASILTQDVILRRGLGFPKAAIRTWQAALEDGKPCFYTAEGFVSTSMASKGYFSSIKPVTFEILARKGTRGLGVATMYQEKVGSEVLLQHGQKFQVTDIKQVMDEFGLSWTTVRMVSVDSRK